MNNDGLIHIAFQNNGNEPLNISTEPSAYMIEIPPQYEYRLITNDENLRFEFNDKDLTFWQEESFGYQLYKKPISSNEWELDIDTLDV